jgi:arabinofuranan 3-O-arabinosyltransferase
MQVSSGATGELQAPLGASADAGIGRPARGTDWYRRWFIGVWLVALVVLMLNARGLIFYDTKLGVVLDPAGFYARLWHLWNPQEWFGALQDQYIGYAFPMAPFYLAGELLRVPVWITERLWLSLLIAVGFTGLVKLAASLKIGTDRSRIVAGLAFALWPTFTIVIGSTSAAILPGLLAPWAVLPLVRAASGGSLTRAAARSAVAVLCMGGVNAACTLDAMLLPALFIATSLHGRRRAGLAVRWAGAVAVATAWWIVPLLLQAKYSFNFLPYVEQSSTTTATMSADAFLRGSGNWTAYLNLGRPWLVAGWVMVAYPLAIMASSLASGTGLLGLSRRDMPAGGWLRLSLGAAALIALAGYPGPLGGLLHQPVDQLLNGAASPLRNVYKVEPAAAAVLALGIAHALVLRTRRAALVADPAPRALWHLLAAPIVALVLLGLAYPQVSGQLLNSGAFASVPRYWYQAASYLRQHSPRAPALVVPAEAHGDFLWGEPIDDPLEPLASSPWVAQSLVPYGGAGSELLLQSLESAITSGQQVPGLAGTLKRSGISYVVVRNDLSPATLDYVQPQVVHQTLLSSGFRRVAAFGPVITGAQTHAGAQQIRYALPSYPAVEVFAAGPAGARPPAAAVALSVSKTVLVNGGPDAMLQLTGQRILAVSAPAVLAGDRLSVRAPTWAVTDSNRRADHALGLIDSTGSYTYTATETNPVDDPLGGAGGPPRQLLPVPGLRNQTVAVIAGAKSVTASSSGSWFAESPQIDPVNVFDGNPRTFWAEANPQAAAGQWVQITFDHPIILPRSVMVRLLDDVASRPVPSKLTVRTDAGALTTAMVRTPAAQPLRVPPGRTSTLRITITAVTGSAPGGLGAGLAGVSIPGVKVTRYLKVPQDPAGTRAARVAFSFERPVPSPASLADVTTYPPLARMFSTPRGSAYTLHAAAIAVPGTWLDNLLNGLVPARKNSLQVTASSSLGSLPSLEPANLFRADHPGPWIAGAAKPVIHLSWQGKRTIRRMTIAPLPGFAAAPEAIKITSPEGTRYAEIGFDGLTDIVPPLRTTQMSISFPVVQYTTTTQPVTGQVVMLPVGLSKLSIPALAGLHPAMLPALRRFSLPCGSGPRITVDGREWRTSVSGRVGALVAFRPVHVRLCGPRSQHWIPPGQHRLTASRPGAFTITGLSLVSASQSARGGGHAAGPAGTLTPQSPTANRARRVTVLAWQQEYRRVRIGPGAASYLELHQNANPGWVATLHGRPLAPARLDGWQQAFVVPAGAGGVVTLTFRPVKFYHVWIILSAAGAAGLVLVAVARRRRRRVGERMDHALPSYPPVRAPTPAAPPAPRAMALARLGPWLGLPASAWLGLAAVTLLIAIVGGPLAVAVPVLIVAANRWPGWLGGIAFVGMIAAGVLTAMAAHPALRGTGAFGAPAQACALVALAAALMPVLPARWGRDSDAGHPGNTEAGEAGAAA